MAVQVQQVRTTAVEAEGPQQPEATGLPTLVETVEQGPLRILLLPQSQQLNP